MSLRMKLVLSTVALLGIVAVFAGTQSILLRNFVYALGYTRTLDAYSQVDTTDTDVTNTRHSDGRDASLLSAFFGLDDALPVLASRVICKGATGKDGMPVIFSHQVDKKTLDPGDFRVTTAAGSTGTVTCLTLAPADDIGELRTVLLVGQYGSADDQPATVEIVGNLLSLDNTVNFKGARVTVTPLEVGPSLVWAETIPEAEWQLGAEGTRIPFGGGSGCPENTKQVVRATWNGGITKPNGLDADDLERQLYKVSVVRSDQTIQDITPFALADLRDGDNNHELCLDTADPARAVSFPAGHVTDPRDDLNPPTSISLVRE